ncbi:hypothetical protein PtA15_3A65 [Puccinia triticina]|uniref:Uncharacterized protein n=1 Tax=Puccinia triticina TaxID=208348 RepID=A0ABY7CBW0_9BASI|nr:uncharacterized protein PtA15_3A65 [Puccinia triticina]WAQ82701.1 hypothetical protein PtA15_3A65 [Puccinia triticina]WAR53197.1 hypothetical protein PtB15_2B628 [Puccinia triticina]
MLILLHLAVLPGPLNLMSPASAQGSTTGKGILGATPQRTWFIVDIAVHLSPF